jgi:UDP-N-acetylglucosamine 1-carboxyvinyltransferase
LKYIEIEGSGPLKGSIRIPGSKNSSLALVAAACLTDEAVLLSGIPNIYDVQAIEGIMKGVDITLTRNHCGDITINSSHLSGGELDIQLTSSYRASYYFIGALLARCKKVTIGYPGGDDFVSRPIDQHVKVFQALGAHVEFNKSHYTVSADRLKGAEIYFDMITSGATINALLAAVLAEGTTVLRNAATDPEVVDTANLLNQMGAKVRGAGTSKIRIDGVERLNGCQYTVIPDRLIAGAFLAAAGATRGQVTVEGIIPEHLGSCIAKLEECGLEITVRDQSITVNGDVPLKAIRVRTAMYPGFATDLQQPFTSMLLRAQGRSIITEKVYPKRFSHVEQLNRLGANVSIRNASAFIQGGAPLKGDWVHATDIRAGVSLLIAGLMAEGVTKLTGVDHIERGYADAIRSFCKLGARMRLEEIGNSNYVSKANLGLS